MSLAQTLRYITSHPLNRDNKLKALSRFIKWQIGSRLMPGDIVYDWINGAKIIVRNGETGLTGNIYAGLHEFHEMAYLLHVLTEKDLFVDIGANAGSYTILACASIGACGYAFEPIPATYSRLLTNIKINNLEDKVKCINMGVGARNEDLNFTCDLDTANHVSCDIGQQSKTIKVKVVPLDSLLQNENPSLMKVDAEGYETPVLIGAEEILKKESLHSLIFEFEGAGKRYGFDENETLQIILDYGFIPYCYDPFSRSINKLSGKNNKTPNTIFIKNEELVLDRINNAKKIKIFGKEI